MQIVEITEQNIAYLVQLGKELVEAGTFGIIGPDFDWDHALANTKAAMQSDNYYIRMALDDNDDPCGFVAGHVCPFYFNPKLIAYEDAWFVREGTPGRARIAMLLMKGMILWALDEKKAMMLQSGDIASIDSTAVWALYSHMGFTRFGAVYKYSRGLV